MKKMHSKDAERKCGFFAFFQKIQLNQREKIWIDKNI